MRKFPFKSLHGNHAYAIIRGVGKIGGGRAARFRAMLYESM